MTPGDRDAIIAAMQDGVYLDPDGRLESWWRNPVVWPLVLEWLGRLLQFNVVQFPDRGDPVEARDVFTRHFTSERPHWFWRECQAVLWRRLLNEVGVTRLIGYVRSDRPDWIERLQGLYGGREVGRTVTGSAARMEYDPKIALAACTGWPRRRSAHGDGVREITLDEALPMIEAAWGERPRKAEALRIAEDWWSLDSATILEVSGHLRILRERFPEEARLAVLTPMPRVLPEIKSAVQGWAHAAGYRRITGIVPVAPERATHILERDQPKARIVRQFSTPDGDVLEVSEDL